ncbi:Membrane protein PB1A10.07c [Trichinella spiralis]|uniref:Membrane protein PB1A10.07c n=1 Tax=Trichinella spiralis TaxID=6334 RepID=A0ABR3L0F7_TRISP
MIVFGLIFLSKSCTFADRPTDRPTTTTTTAATTTTITAAITTIITIIIFIIGDVDFFLQPTSAFCEENLSVSTVVVVVCCARQPKTNEPQEREKKNM